MPGGSERSRRGRNLEVIRSAVNRLRELQPEIRVSTKGRKS
jgi:hypothetical protein